MYVYNIRMYVYIYGAYVRMCIYDVCVHIHMMYVCNIRLYVYMYGACMKQHTLMYVCMYVSKRGP